MSINIDEKVRMLFGEYAVDKSLTRTGSVSRIPAFIAEFMIGRLCSEPGEKCIDEVTAKVNELYPEPSSRELFLGRLKEKGAIKILDEFRVRVNLKKDLFLLQIPALSIDDALIDERIIKENERLYSGLWGVGLLIYDPGLQTKGKNLTPVMMEDFEPFQAYNIDVEVFREARTSFSLGEWIDVLVTSVGLNPSAYSLKQKLLLLVRLIPMAEANVNILELGPRATGKTFTYRNLTYYSRIYSGGIVSPAKLFYDARSNIPGDLVVNDVVVFDEISKIKFSNSDEVVAKLKDYMVDGYFERGGFHPKRPSTCSLVLIGNVDAEKTATTHGIISHLPSFMHDTAFLDRVHGFIHGWELPKIMKSDEHLARGYGIASDYLAEVLHRIRTESLEKEVESTFELQGAPTIRDEKAVKKLLSGALKLLFPDEGYDKEELALVAEPLVELRNNVNRLLNALSPREFPARNLRLKVRG
ncbi:MAG: BREX system Lon protease-like protein BrxL [Infirmifilum sp.]|uniref:BREX system Lon protease-like protein BrxL n=1 Tax=Infirmifilum TaxID=2856573 RepID=UPI003C767544